ncbi:class I tRNA ligase family protein [Butyrivibrio sp. XBB1001]|uniref:class I tRNA ligase family protein n=1 Tax=Butyrivibrio sp. XBB1001 TaxID=1280682 RepID=UPI0004797287|nr:class I tRNA ligase family protein [Butyrivibrio sp. XBB1001]
MNLRNCARCGKMFNYIGGQPVCEACKKAIEEDFQKVKQYIVDNPRAGLKEIAEENGVTTKQIQQWIREERLMFTSDSPLQIQCENCGAQIQTGRYCAKCKASMANNLNNTFAKPQPAIQQPVKKEGKAGMHFLDT